MLQEVIVKCHANSLLLRTFGDFGDRVAVVPLDRRLRPLGSLNFKPNQSISGELARGPKLERHFRLAKALLLAQVGSKRRCAGQPCFHLGDRDLPAWSFALTLNTGTSGFRLYLQNRNDVGGRHDLNGARNGCSRLHSVAGRSHSRHALPKESV